MEKSPLAPLFNGMITNGFGNLFDLIYAAILNLVLPYGSLDVKCLHRYIDENCEQSITRVKKIWIDNGELFVNTDENNSESYPSDVHFDYDEDFEKETEWKLNSFSKHEADNVMLLYDLYDEIYNYAIPRLQKQVQP